MPPKRDQTKMPPKEEKPKMTPIDTSGGNVFGKVEHEAFSKFIASIEPEIKRMEEKAKASSEKKAAKGAAS